ncbi:hypothetical protein EC957_008073, partial [Mortierella hygrophila]
MPPPLSPLDIPEILEQILSHVDESTIEQSVSRVNRTWFLLTRHRTNQNLVFNTNRRRGDFYTVMARLPEATRLWWHAAYGRDRANQWKKLVKLLKVKDLRFRESKGITTTIASASQHRLGAGAGAGTGTRTAKGTGTTARGEDQENREYGYREHDLRRSSTYNDAVSWTMQERPLLELRLSGCLIINLRFPPLLPYIQFLTVLKLTMWEENKFDRWMENGFDMRAVLTRCGSTLQVLHIRTISIIQLDGPWIPKRFPTPLFVEPLPERWEDHAVAYQWNQGNDSSQEQESESTNVLALRELVLERASFYLNSLEALLCFTPHLDTLRLIELYDRMNSSPLGNGQRRLIAFLHNPQFPQGQILPLRSYTFSLASIVPAASTAASIANVEQEIKHAQLELCPDANEWTFFTPDLSLPLLKFLEEEVQNVVTTLELRNEDLDIFSPDPVLHRYLCASPHLLHLRAKNTLYLVDLLDIHGWMEMTSSSITSQGGVATPRGRGTGATRVGVGAFDFPIGPPGIWACKNLQTLHIFFCSASGIHFYTHGTTKPSPVTRKISSRI